MNLHVSCRLFFFRCRKQKVEQYADNGRKTDSAHGERAKGKNGSANTHGKHHTHNDDIARLFEINLVVDEVLRLVSQNLHFRARVGLTKKDLSLYVL